MENDHATRLRPRAQLRRGQTGAGVVDDARATFRDAISERAKQLTALTLTITYHEEKPGECTNVHLDSVEPAKLYAALTPLAQRVAHDVEEPRARSEE